MTMMYIEPPADEAGFRDAAVASAHSALSHFTLPPECESYLIGSTAEGFGNPLSDIDILIAIAAGPDREPVFRQYTWVGEQRVETYARSIDDLGQFVRRLNALNEQAVEAIVRRGGSEEDALEEDLEMYHRFLFAYPVTQNGLMAPVRAIMDHEKVKVLRATLEQTRYIGNTELALAAGELGLSSLSTSYARSALEAAASSWCARQGQTYAGKKFLSWRLQRAGLPTEDIERFEELTSENAPGLLHRSVDFSRFVELFAMPAITTAAQFRWNDAVMEVRLTDQNWVGDTQRTVVYPRPVIGAFDAAIGSGPAILPDDLEVRRYCFLAGLAQLETRFGRTYALRQAVDDPHGALLTAKGFARVPARPFVVSQGLSMLVDAGMAIATAGFLCANCKEDAIGALRASRWRQFEIALARMRQFTLDALAYSETFRAAPIDVDGIDVLRHSTATEIRDDVRRAAALRCRDAQSAEQALSASELIFARLPPEVFGLLQHASSSAFGGMAFIELVFVWGKVAKGIGKAVMSKGLRKSLAREWDSILEQTNLGPSAVDLRVHVKPEMFQFNWARSDDMRAALAELAG
jgi:hypothetical protein